MGLAATAATVAVAGTVLSAYSQYEQGQSQKEWSEYNAAIAERDAAASRQTAEYEATEKRKETQRLLGRQRALYGKAGVTLEGSPLLMMEETASEGEIDALMIEREGKLRSQHYRSEAALSKQKGRAAARAGYWGAGTTLLTGAGSAMSAYGSRAKGESAKKTD